MKKKIALGIIIFVLFSGITGCGIIREIIEEDPLGEMIQATLPGTLERATASSPTSTPQPGGEDIPDYGYGPFILMKDDFSDPASGWEEYSNEDGQAGYSDGVYLVETYNPDIYAWGVAGQHYDDIRIEVDVTITQTNSALNDGFGVDCRTQENGDGYGFRISSDGYASIEVFEDNEGSLIADWIATDAIHTDGSPNHLTVICQGDHLSLLVNDMNVAEAEDDTFSSGDIALSAIAYDEGSIIAEFDDIIVQQLGNPYEYEDQEEFTVVMDNPTTYEACTVLIDPSTEEYWGDNWLNDGEVIAAGETKTFEGISGNPVDIRVETCQHVTLFEYYDINLDGNSSVVLEEPVVLLHDPFDSIEGWTSGDVDGGSFSHRLGDYLSLSVNVADKLITGDNGFEIDDGIVQTDASLVKSGSDNLGMYGVTCRMQPDGSGIFFAVRGDGSASIIKLEGEEMIELTEWYPSGYINAGISSNYIEGDCTGSTYAMFVNGVYIDSVEDAEYTSGKVGVAVFSPSGETIQADFDYLDVYESN